MPELDARLIALHARIANAEQTAQRSAGCVRLIAASKTVPPDIIRAAYHAGQVAFGENYPQEALAKIVALSDLRDALEWHLIGPLQSNKTRLVAEHFDWVHSIDRYKIAQRLSEQRPDHLPPLNVCVQVNVSGASTKSGVAPTQVRELAQQIAALPRLKLRGLMSIPEPAQTLAEQRAPHRQLYTLYQALRADGLVLDTISAGMSADLEAAILEGATLVRIGTALFGQRASSSSSNGTSL